MIDPKDLRKIVRFCQKNGILRFKSGDFEIELSKALPMRGASKEINVTDEAPSPFPSWDSLTPEQKLLWSATPDIQAT